MAGDHDGKDGLKQAKSTFGVTEKFFSPSSTFKKRTYVRSFILYISNHLPHARAKRRRAGTKLETGSSRDDRAFEVCRFSLAYTFEVSLWSTLNERQSAEIPEPDPGCATTNLA